MKKVIFMTLSVLVLSLQAKVLIISDIDDTIKKANTMNSVSVVWYFLKAEPFEEMAGIYREMEDFYLAQGEEVEFVYLSAAYDATFDQDKWLNKYNFPKGEAILRKLTDGKTYEYKYKSLKRVLENEDPSSLELILFGDNSDQDPKVYKDIVKDLNIKNSSIYIRDVSTYATYWQGGWEIKKLPEISYFFSEIELRNLPEFYFLSNSLTSLIETNYQSRKLVPRYTFKTLLNRVEKLECAFDRFISCDKYKDDLASHLWEDYHTRH